MDMSPTKIFVLSFLPKKFYNFSILSPFKIEKKISHIISTLPPLKITNSHTDPTKVNFIKEFWRAPHYTKICFKTPAQLI